MSGGQDHEIVEVFKSYLHPLSEKLTEMLNEHYSHQTERRGCGYTQATRVIAEIVNQPRDHQNFQDLRLFADYDPKLLKYILNQSRKSNLIRLSKCKTFNLTRPLLILQNQV